MTPAHPPRPPISALPQPMAEPPAPMASKHPLPQPAQQGPPNKAIRSKAFPQGQDGKPLVAPPAAPAVDIANVEAPTPKSPPTSMMPTAFEAQAARPPSPCAAAAQTAPEAQAARQAAFEAAKQMFQGPPAAQGTPMAIVTETSGQRPKIQYVRSPTDIDWKFLFISDSSHNSLVVQIPRSHVRNFESCESKFHTSQKRPSKISFQERISLPSQWSIRITPAIMSNCKKQRHGSSVQSSGSILLISR